MIVDIDKFINEEKPSWEELEAILQRLDIDPFYSMSLEQIKRLHYLYQRTSADLAKIMTFASEPELRQYLESLVSKAYGEIHEVRKFGSGWSFSALATWFTRTFPQTFRKHVRAFWLALAITGGAAALGAAAIVLHPQAKQMIFPFRHLLMDPSERVKQEEQFKVESAIPHTGSFMSSYYVTHNTKVSILVLALGMTWGIGTIMLLFYNGVILGAVFFDYIAAGESKFVFGWLLPHGSVEIPAILIAGQAGLVLASAVIGWGQRYPLRARLRLISRELLTLISGVAILLAWAAVIEAFFSQYHEPLLPYFVKIAFGVAELILLSAFLARAGKET